MSLFRLPVMARSIVLGAFIYAAISAARPLFMGLSYPTAVVAFFLPAFAQFCAMCLVLAAARISGLPFVALCLLLAPLLSGVQPVYLNLQQQSLSEYLASTDANILLGILIFSVAGALVAALVVERLRKIASGNAA